MKLILLGPPAAGKGTQAEKLSKHFDIPTISTGEMIRREVAMDTPLGREAEKLINKGNLVPDDIICNMIRARISEKDCEKGFILDGFPRTIRQAEEAEKMGILVDKVVLLSVPDEKIIERISGRRQCENCGEVYHMIFSKPAKENECDKCGGNLICRKDDTEETVKTRLSVYHEKTRPLKDFYEEKGLLVEVVGQETIEDTTREMFKVLGV